MKKIEKLQKQVDELSAKIKSISFDRKDTSFRRSGGYYGTDKAYLDDCVVIYTYARTRYLNTYSCIAIEHKHLFDQLQALRDQLGELVAKQWAKDSINKCVDRVNADIADGTVCTNYGKMFIQGNKHIYYAHPRYGHSDYNKACMMPNTKKHWAIAQELNTKLIEAGLKLS